MFQILPNEGVCLNIHFNGQPLDIEGLTGQTVFSELIDCVEQHARQAGITLLEIVVDGKSFPYDERKRIEDETLSSFQSIEFVGSTLREIIRSAVFDHSEALDHLETLMENISGDLRIGKVKEAMQTQIEFVDCLVWLSSMLEHLSKGFIEGMIESGLEKRRIMLVKALDEKMAMLKKSQEDQDWVGMADVLEYEFPDVVKEARNLFRTVKVSE